MLADIGEADVAAEQIDELRKTVDPSVLEELAQRCEVNGPSATACGAESEHFKTLPAASYPFPLLEDRAAVMAFDRNRDEEHQGKCCRE